MDIISGITAATQALGIAKTLRTIEKSYDEATYKAQVAELICVLSDAKVALSDAKDSLAERDKEIERLKAGFATRGELYVGPGDYKFFTDEENLPTGFPICPRCEVTDGLIVQLKQDNVIIQAKCPVCLNVYRPVECFIPQESGGPTTLLKIDERKRKIESERVTLAMRSAGRKLA